MTTTLPPTATVDVDIDVLPRCVRNDGRGVIPVVVYGNAEADLGSVDIATVELDGMPVRSSFGWPLAVWLDLDADGHLDLLALIDDIAGAIPAGATTVTLTAELDDGTSIAGSDTVCLIPVRP